VRDVFAGRHLTDGTGLIAVDMPARAEDAGIVPVTLSATIPPGDKRIPVAFTLVIDINPSPVAATFKVGPGVTTISTRVRVNDYTNVRSIATTPRSRLTRRAQRNANCTTSSSDFMR
jgi:sulfur-oxidizing protein SoxY